MTQPLLDVVDLTRHHRLPAAKLFTPPPVLKAVDGVSFTLPPATLFAVVGESGCGKSTLARMIMALDRPTSGTVTFQGQSLFDLPGRQLQTLRRQFQMVFQDPFGSLDPRQTVARLVAEPLHLDPNAPKGQERRRLIEGTLAEVGLKGSDADRYPHEFSGGQRQRIAIARALITRPALIVADEPVSALDLSVQAQVLNLLLDLQQSHGLAYLLISHNLAVVEHVSTQLAVMYLGRFVETGPTAEIYRNPAHPYTKLLLEAAPSLDPTRRRHRQTMADGTKPPAQGCAFAPRCPLAGADCHARAPSLRQIAPGRQAACHLI